MTKFNEHPTDDQLLAFMQGEESDRQEIEFHLASCKDCSDFLLSIEQAELFTKVAPEQSDQARLQRQLSIMKRVVSEQAKADRNIAKTKDVKSGNKSSTSQWGALGALGGLIGGGILGVPQPSLGGHEEGKDDGAPGDLPIVEPSPEHLDEHSSDNVENFSQFDVIVPTDDLSMDLNNNDSHDWYSNEDSHAHDTGLDEHSLEPPEDSRFDEDTDIDGFDGP